MMPWSTNNSLSQPEFGSCPMRNILFFHGALVQWKNPRTISLVSLQIWFQYFSTGRESLHGFQKSQWIVARFLSSPFSLSSLQTRLYCVILFVQQHCPVICQEKWCRFLAMGSSGAGSACVCSEIVNITFWPHFKLGVLSPMHCRDLSFWRYPSVDQMMLKTGHVFQYGLELIQWKIAWSLNWESFCVVNQSNQLIPAVPLTYPVLYSPWDPGIWARLCFFGLFTQAEPKVSRNVAAPAYYRGHGLDHAYFFNKVCANQDYYLAVFCDQVHIGHNSYIGVFLEQVCVSCYLGLMNNRGDLIEVMKLQVPWDPGGSTMHRLEVKPKFKEEGMLAANPTLD